MSSYHNAHALTDVHFTQALQQAPHRLRQLAPRQERLQLQPQLLRPLQPQLWRRLSHPATPRYMALSLLNHRPLMGVCSQCLAYKYQTIPGSIAKQTGKHIAILRQKI